LNELKAETAYSEEATRYVEVKLYKRVALLNSGAESPESSIVIPTEIAEKINSLNTRITA
jgi:hypothetical protein